MMARATRFVPAILVRLVMWFVVPFYPERRVEERHPATGFVVRLWGRHPWKGPRLKLIRRTLGEWFNDRPWWSPKTRDTSQGQDRFWQFGTYSIEWFAE